MIWNVSYLISSFSDTKQIGGERAVLMMLILTKLGMWSSSIIKTVRTLCDELQELRTRTLMRETSFVNYEINEKMTLMIVMMILLSYVRL